MKCHWAGRARLPRCAFGFLSEAAKRPIELASPALGTSAGECRWAKALLAMI